MSIADLAPHRFPAAWRWIIERVWRLEHAFERARAAGKAEDDTRLRILFVLAVFALLFLGAAVGATYAALFSDAGKGGAGAGLPVNARADLVDRNGKLLAMDLTHYAVYVDPDEVWDKAETRAALLGALPKLPPKRLDRVLGGAQRRFIFGGLTPDQKRAIHDLGLPGVTFEPEVGRSYPLGETASHLIGFAKPDGAGQAGAEASLEKALVAGAKAGQPVALSIDLRVQGALEDELAAAAAEFKPRGAVGIVTDIHTGEILGMASWPDFDPNRPGDFSPEQKLNRAAASVFEMGSTFKAFTVAIGLDTGVATPTSTFDARTPFQMGYRTIHDYHGTNRILTLVEVFNHSSNIGTAKLAEGIGPQRLESYFKALGLTRSANVELRESTRPLTPKNWGPDDIASVSFGHGIDVSPLTLAQAMGAILNGGNLIPLTIRKMPEGYCPKGERVISEKTSLTMLQIMRANVVSGTGRKADAPGLNVGGKTGTGEKYDPGIRAYSNYKQIASFAAVFPTDGPITAKRYFVLILLDEPQGGIRTGGIVAAPAVGKVIDRIAPFLGVQRRAPMLPTFGITPISPEGGL
jgi:cell division protein FtsI (penicillin-binding protein 3)